ncbi:MAG: DMT family transporter [Acidobacteriota bacterium]
MEIKAKIALLTACLFWAASFIATKIALASVPPISVVSLRLIISALCFIAWIYIKGEGFKIFTRSNFFQLVLLSIFGTGLHYSIQTIGLQYTTASKGGVYAVTGPITILLIAAVFLKEKVTVRKGIGVGIALLGVIIVMGFDTIIDFNLKGNLLGDLLVLISIVMWGIFTVMGKSITSKMSALKMTAAITIIGAVYMIPAAIAEVKMTGFTISSIKNDAWLSIFFLGVTCSFLATLLYVYALSISESQKVGVYLYTIPLMTQVIAFLVLKESIGMSLLAGSFVVISGLYLTEKG